MPNSPKWANYGYPHNVVQCTTIGNQDKYWEFQDITCYSSKGGNTLALSCLSYQNCPSKNILGPLTITIQEQVQRPPLDSFVIYPKIFKNMVSL